MTTIYLVFFNTTTNSHFRIAFSTKAKAEEYVSLGDNPALYTIEEADLL
jgi:hypothetical protein